MAQRSGINRGLMWLRKTLEITEETDSPRVLSEKLRPMIDVFGWERLQEATLQNRVGAAATDNVTSTQVPVDICRCVLEASVVNSDTAIAIDLWISHRGLIGGTQEVAIGPVFPQQIGREGTPGSINRMVFLQPGERIIGRSNPAPGVGEELTLTFRFIDLPFGEYIPYL